MSETEDPVTTVVRLLAENMHVVGEAGAIAKIHVGREWVDRELFKNYEGQITVGLAESRDTKIELSGRLRRRLDTLRVNVWSQNRFMRQKMVEEVNRIVKQNRNKPNVTLYDFAGLGYPLGEPHKAFQAGNSNELAPGDAGWTELTSLEYEKIWYSDENRLSKSRNVNGEYSLLLFRFKIESRKQTIKEMVLAFEGYGTAPAGNGVTIKIWNHAAQAWQQAQSGTGGADETVAITLTMSIDNYVDDDGYVWLLARTTNASNGATPATLFCDYAFCTATVKGITYLDVESFRDVDLVDVKPFLFHTSFTLKSWSFEDVGGIF